ncbi:flagellar filament capping protein FliD [Ectothiorhodospira haloalkaliphila]|uniref:flagellar filament capping protein FliD n=1 Tax=Ectothiorhodospira haloalkaliphila TaxID=421628 RepID=UPI001EE8A851|nr:flagellar filament capping protein FliD [Ectothiorhodospira haloalkaliphila]MCG5524769.1 flagellar filament capping protein FliD [Ectothiorhodospira haloalkaliphila]
MATISSMGVGSGIDVRGLVDELVAAERKAPEQRIERREQRLEAEISGLGKLQGALEEFGSALNNLKQPADFRQVDARVADESVLSASASRNAPPGSYDVEVVKLAQAQRMATNADLFGAGFSAGSDSLGAGSITLRFGDGQVSETFSLEEGADTLQDLRAAINAQSTNVRANVVDDGNGPRLVLSSTQPGEQNAITAIDVDIDDESAALNLLQTDLSGVGEDESNGGFTLLRQSQNAELLVDGLRVTRPTNEISGVIEGVDLTLTGVERTRVNVSEKPGIAREAVDGFVEAYNALRSQLNELNAFDPETGESGLLNGDATLRGVQGRLAQMLGNAVEGMEGNVRALADIGITTDRDGSLRVNDFRLDAALSDNRDAVVQLFTQENDGIASRLEGVVKEFTDRDSIIRSRTETLRQSLSGLADDRERLDRRMDRVEARYIAQFSAMDAMVAQMNQTSEFLDNQLAALNNNRK